MSPPSKILDHPDKNDIIQWLTQGMSVREVEKRLSQKYPKKGQSHLRVSHSTIQSFKTNHLNIKGKVLEDIKDQTSSMRMWQRNLEKQKAVEETTAYQQAITKIAEEELDVRKELLKVFTIIESRIESLFEKVHNDDYINKDLEKSLQGYLDQFLKVLDQHKKYVEGYKETTEHNVNINIVNDQVTLLREAIRETMVEIDPSLALEFMNKFSIKLRELTYTDESGVSEAILNKALGHSSEL